MQYNKLFLKKKIIILQNVSLEEVKIIKDVRNLFRLTKELNYTAIKDIGNIFRLEKETKAIQEENFCKPARVIKFWSTII